MRDFTTYSCGGRIGARARQETPRSFVLVVLTLQLDGRQPDLLAVRVRLEGEREDAARGGHVVLDTSSSMHVRESTSS